MQFERKVNTMAQQICYSLSTFKSLNMYYVAILKQFLQPKAFLWILLWPLKNVSIYFPFAYHLLSRTDMLTINYSA